jgi:hypothetical protein
MTRPEFRFMDLEVWSDAVEVGNRLFNLAAELLEKLDHLCSKISKFQSLRD